LNVLKIAALVLASAAGALAVSASAGSPSKLDSSSRWWEKVTVTINGDGKPQSCLYETSLKPADSQDCDVAPGQAAMAGKASSSKGEFTRITFERRFDPGVSPMEPALQKGDTLLGGQVMVLAIDPRGAVKDCHIVATSGAMRPQYSCSDATAERFQASVGTVEKARREGYMTILVYGHSEHIV
jgi:hypothetical protein